MAFKAHPKGFRLGISEEWKGAWFNPKKTKEWLKEDNQIREFLFSFFPKMTIEDIFIERVGEKVKVLIKTPKPGVVIGKRGDTLKEISQKIKEIVGKKELKIEVEETKNPRKSASLIAQQIAHDIERRVPFRQAVKRAMQRIKEEKDIKGAKIRVSGRLDGATIARPEVFKFGSLPLQKLFADIDYAYFTAKTKWGIIGVKVWLYFGEKKEV